MTEPLMTMREVAAVLHFSYGHFQRSRAAMIRDQGFPPAVINRRWSRAAVMAWIAARSTPAAPEPSKPSSAVLHGRAQLDMLRAA